MFIILTFEHSKIICIEITSVAVAAAIVAAVDAISAENDFKWNAKTKNKLKIFEVLSTANVICAD